MAGRIAGITIEIGGNTTKLQSALKGVNGSIRGLKSSLRDVDRLLKFKPTSTELLRQKQQMLRTAIEQTKSKLDTLNQAMDQMKANGVDETSDEYQRLQREIIATEQELKKLEGEYASVASVAGAKMQAVGDKMQQVGQKISEVGQSITQHVTVPLVAAGAASIAAFKNVDKGMDSIVAKTGASGKSLEEMKDIAKSLAIEIPTDFETAGQAVGEVATRFKLSGKELEDLSGQFIKFAQLNKTDVSTAIDSVQSAMAAFGLSADQAGAYLDTLNAVGQQTGADVGRLAQEMMTNAASLKELGFNASDAAHFLGELSVNGVDSAQVMSGLKRAFSEAAKDGVSMKDKLAQLQDTMKNASTDSDAYAAALEVFGNRAGPALASAIREGRLSLEELGTSLEDNVGNIDQTFKNTLDPVDEFKMALNNLKLVGADLGKSILSVLTPALQKLSSFIKNVKAKFESLSPKQQEMIVKIGMVAAAIGPALVVIGKLTSGLGTVVSVVGKVVSAFAAASAGVGPLGAALTALTGPVGVIVAAIGAVSAAVVYLYNTNEEFRAKCQGIWDQIKDIISSALELIKTVIGAFVKVVKAFWAKWGDQIKQVVGTVFSWIADRIKTSLTIIQNIIKAITAVIHGDWSAVWTAIKNIIAAVWANIKAVISAALGIVKSIITGAWSAVKVATSAVWDGIKSVISSVWEGIKSKVSSVVNSIKSTLSNAWSSIKSTASNMWNSIKEAVIGPFRSAFDTVSGWVNKIKGLFPIGLGKLFTGTLTTVTAKVKEAAGTASVSYTTGAQQFAKAYTNPFLFTSPTLLPGNRLVGDRGSQAGGELVYGRDNLMNDIREAANPITAKELYNIVLAAIDHADMRVNISGREFGRIIREV